MRSLGRACTAALLLVAACGRIGLLDDLVGQPDGDADADGGSDATVWGGSDASTEIDATTDGTLAVESGGDVEAEEADAPSDAADEREVAVDASPDADATVDGSTDAEQDA